MADSTLGFSTRQTARASGLTVRQVGYWASSGFVIPSVANPSGRGNGRKFSVPDVYAYAVLGELRNRGVSLQALRAVQRFLRECDGLELQNEHARLVFFPGDRKHDVALARSDQEAISLILNPGQHLTPFVVDAGRLFKQVRDRLDEVRRERADRIAARKRKHAEKERNRRAKSSTQRRSERAA